MAKKKAIEATDEVKDTTDELLNDETPKTEQGPVGPEGEPGEAGKEDVVPEATVTVNAETLEKAGGDITKIPKEFEKADEEEGETTETPSNPAVQLAQNTKYVPPEMGFWDGMSQGMFG